MSHSQLATAPLMGTAPAPTEPDATDEDSDIGKKRERDKTIDDESVDDKRNRGNYRCSRCNLPKKGEFNLVDLCINL